MSVCIVHKDVCAVCGGPVEGGSDNGTLDIPVGGQKVICLSCLFFGREGDGEAEEAFSVMKIPCLIKSELKEMT